MVCSESVYGIQTYHMHYMSSYGLYVKPICVYVERMGCLGSAHALQPHHMYHMNAHDLYTIYATKAHMGYTKRLYALMYRIWPLHVAHVISCSVYGVFREHICSSNTPYALHESIWPLSKSCTNTQTYLYANYYAYANEMQLTSLYLEKICM